MISRAVIFSFLITGLFISGCDTGITIANRGSSAYRIVISRDASPSTVYGADELSRFLEQMTGSEIPIVTDNEPITENEIILGKNKHLDALNRVILHRADGETSTHIDVDVIKLDDTLYKVIDNDDGTFTFTDNTHAHTSLASTDSSEIEGVIYGVEENAATGEIKLVERLNFNENDIKALRALIQEYVPSQDIPNYDVETITRAVNYILDIIIKIRVRI